MNNNTVLNMFDFQAAVIEALKADAAFNQDVIDKLGKPLNYFIDINEIDSTLQYPVFVMHKNTNINDVEQQKQSMFQFIFGAMLGEVDKTPDGVDFYPSIRDIELLSRRVLDIISNVVCNSTSYELVHWNMLVTTIGEADDVQMVTSFRLEQLQFI